MNVPVLPTWEDLHYQFFTVTVYSQEILPETMDNGDQWERERGGEGVRGIGVNMKISSPE